MEKIFDVNGEVIVDGSLVVLTGLYGLVSTVNGIRKIHWSNGEYTNLSDHDYLNTDIEVIGLGSEHQDIVSTFSWK